MRRRRPVTRTAGAVRRPRAANPACFRRPARGRTGRTASGDSGRKGRAEHPRSTPTRDPVTRTLRAATAILCFQHWPLPPHPGWRYAPAPGSRSGGNHLILWVNRSVQNSRLLESTGSFLRAACAPEYLYMNLARAVSDSSSPAGHLIVGLILLSVSTFLLRLCSKRATLVPDAGAREGFQLRIGSNKVIPIDRSRAVPEGEDFLPTARATTKRFAAMSVARAKGHA